MIGSGAAIFGCAGVTLTAAERDFFRDYDPLGFIIFARNVETPEQLTRLTASLRDSVGRDAPILVDQEGGRVQRLRPPYWSEWAAPLDTVEKAGVNAARAMALRAQVIAVELRAVGIDANCAPVADIGGPDTHPFLRNRCYGQDAETVTHIARAVADAHLAMGVLPVVKHMPGHGRSINDTHHDLPTVTTDRATLSTTDFAPFRALSDLPMAMTAHIIFSAYDSLPATQSPAMIKAIREEIGFAGLLMTDDLNMQALEGSLGQRTARSMAAGCDIALHCKGDLAEMLEVAAAAAAMTEAARSRATAALAQRRPAPSVDIAALKAEFSALMGENTDG
ncbi:beta-N-acetylhexosaminidase [Cypionkella sp.]|uniref:beta-N-acetylhexosaminidase n=1 Tax=Cypionkella sp. TaxID=2811411 RepID=UPI002ABCEE8F|nr:beta-N-acetylhexosaminidase [Cypionkella sp.]MDZ4393749.1 beta-N-acetylhexosaminidase [Cypionkella sp.]